MKFLKEQLTLTSNGNRVSYHNITEEVKAMVEKAEFQMESVSYSLPIRLVLLSLKNTCMIQTLTEMNFFKLI